MKQSEKNPFGGHRERLRQKYLLAGHDGMLDYEKIELLLTYAISRRDVKPLAKILLKEFGSIPGIMDASPEELQKIPGIGPNVSILFQLLRGFGQDYLYQKIQHRDMVESSEDILKYAKMKLAGLQKEVFMTIFLNTKNEIISSEILVEGTVDQLFLHPRELISKAIEKNARGIILVHNHPGGSAKASAADLHLTNAIKTIANAMRIDIVDHLIVTRDSCYSIGSEKIIQMPPPFHTENMPKAAEPNQDDSKKTKRKKTPAELSAEKFAELARLSALSDLDHGKGPKHTRPVTNDEDFQIIEDLPDLRKTYPKHDNEENLP